MALVLLTSCSLTSMTPVQSDWDHRTDPRCDADKAFAIADGVGAVVFAGLAVAAAVAGHGNDRAAGAAIGGVAAVGLGISSGVGLGWADECTKAKKIYDDEQIRQSKGTR